MFVVAVMFVVGAASTVVAKRFHLGSVIGLLVAGMLLGPHSPVPLFTGHVKELEAVGEIGVMLLLFAIALDLQPSRLWSMRRLVFGLGAAQYVVTTAVIVGLLIWMHGGATAEWRSAVVVSLGLAMSSAAIPFPVLEQRGEMGTPHGRAVIAIDIFQGLMVIPVLAVIPLLRGARTDTDLLQLAIEGR